MFSKGRKIYKWWNRTCGCFAAGTLVATPDGLVAIETLEIGDLVLAQNEATGEIAPKAITDLICPEPKPLYLLTLRDAWGEIETFHATDDHPWKVEGKGWVETIALAEGDRIDTASGEDLVLLSVALTERVEQTYLQLKSSPVLLPPSSVDRPGSSAPEPHVVLKDTAMSD